MADVLSSEIFERYLRAAVPRYTSYPTVPNFSAAIGSDNYCDWLVGFQISTPNQSQSVARVNA